MNVPERKRYKTKSEGLDAGWFYNHLYRFTVHFVWNGDGKDLVNYVKREFDCEIPDSDCVGRCVEVMKDGWTGYAHVIFLKQFRKMPRDISILSHEVFHATEQILGQRGVNFHNDQTNEAFAYLHEYIMQECLELLYQPPKKKLQPGNSGPK